MSAPLPTARTIAIAAAGIGLLCACGIPPPPHPIRPRLPPAPPPLELMTVSPLRLDFTGAPGESTSQTVTLTNRSADTLGLGRMRLVSGLHGRQSPFQVAATTCTFSLLPQASCTATIAFAPYTAGHSADTLLFDAYASAILYETVIPLEGAATPAPAATSH